MWELGMLEAPIYVSNKMYGTFGLYEYALAGEVVENNRWLQVSIVRECVYDVMMNKE